MLKKAKAQLRSGQVEQVRELAQAARDSSHRIWLAGLGAFSKAREEGGKVFDALVKEGEAIEAQTRKVAMSTAGFAAEAAKAKAKEMQAMANGTWDKLEQVFEERVARSLRRLGVYRSVDFKVLSDRVNALAQAVDELVQTKPARATRAAPAKRAAKSAAGRTPAAAKTARAARVRKPKSESASA